MKHGFGSNKLPCTAGRVGEKIAKKALRSPIGPQIAAQICCVNAPPRNVGSQDACAAYERNADFVWAFYGRQRNHPGNVLSIGQWSNDSCYEPLRLTGAVRHFRRNAKRLDSERKVYSGGNAKRATDLPCSTKKTLTSVPLL